MLDQEEQMMGGRQGECDQRQRTCLSEPDPTAVSSSASLFPSSAICIVRRNGGQFHN